MINIFLFGCLIQSTGLVNGKSQRFLKIINGSTLDIKSRPYMVSIGVHDVGATCGGSIISQHHVLTAYHCIMDQNMLSRYYIRSGSSYHDVGGALHMISHLYPYSSEFTANNEVPVHDIMVLKVYPDFEFSSTTKPAELPLPNEKPPDVLTVTGWGKMEDFTRPRMLRVTEVRKIPSKDCAKCNSIYGDLLNTENHLCYGTAGKDSCHGDSGGPLADKFKVHGIVSFGLDCGKHPGVYVKVARYSSWIREIMRYSDSFQEKVKKKMYNSAANRIFKVKNPSKIYGW